MLNSLEMVLILLVVATLAIALFRRLGLPPLLGYLLSGILLGPHALGLIPEDASFYDLADFGVVFLMFTVGLEFSLQELFELRQTVLGLGSVQVLLSGLLAAAASWFLGLSWQASLVAGAALSLSSTAIMSRLLAERLELKSPQGQRVMGILLFQDLAVVPLLIILPALYGKQGDLLTTLGLAGLKVLVAFALLLVFGRRLMGVWFDWVAQRKSSELFILNVLLATLGMAWVTQKLGLSLALGAFLAGMLLSETNYRYQVQDYIKPFRDVLLGLFFITIGSLLNLGLVALSLHWVLLALALAFAAKALITYGICRLAGDRDAISLRTALAIAPAGEFGLVLLAQVQGRGLMPDDFLQVLLAAQLISMLLSPLLIQASDKIVLYLCESEWAMRSLALHTLSVKSYAAKGHVVVCGFGRSGQVLAQFLEQEGFSILAVDLDSQRVHGATAAGKTVVYGDASRREVLVSAGIHRASALVVAFSDTAAALAILSHVRELEPELPVLVRSRDDSDLDRLKEAGASEVVPELLEGSLMMASQVLLQLGVPLSRVVKKIRTVRQERYRQMQAFVPGVTDEASTENPPEIG
jgi:CPA2 family monovalent cation:H+ antiporter-2